MMPNKLNSINQWPIPGPEARKKKRIFIIKPGEMLDVIHGKENHLLVSFAVSNDFIHFGSMIIPGGLLSDPEIHRGDEVFYVLEGCVSVIVSDTAETESVSKSRYEVNSGQRFLIPEGTSHRYLNTTTRPAKLIFGIAPRL